MNYREYVMKGILKHVNRTQDEEVSEKILNILVNGQVHADMFLEKEGIKLPLNSYPILFFNPDDDNIREDMETLIGLGEVIIMLPNLLCILRIGCWRIAIILNPQMLLGDGEVRGMLVSSFIMASHAVRDGYRITDKAAHMETGIFILNKIFIHRPFLLMVSCFLSERLGTMYKKFLARRYGLITK